MAEISFNSKNDIKKSLAETVSNKDKFDLNNPKFQKEFKDQNK